ncbi:MAG: 2-C-methyl-D-erythritol 2,4-cyclodiphosphate synthase [Bacillota bacterium]|nr:MAG: 2-C-methyl-D-erythritol 2,4-cyclodiphosphate synthase [Bacillota bacterium]
MKRTGRSAGSAGDVAYRVGLGFDSHRYIAGRPLVLGGVKIPFLLGLDGHSDADALIHAVMDAVLGAAGRGNIGERFPDDDPAYEGADSASLLRAVWDELAADGYRVINLDCVVVAEKPRLNDHVAAMRRRLGEILGVSPARVNVKPKTAEGLGSYGRGEGLAATAVVLLAAPMDSRAE